MKKLLITGGSGFLGRNLAIKLKENYRVILTSRNNKQNFLTQKITGCEVIPMDVTNIESIRDVFNEVKPDIVIHAAATKFVDLCEKFPMETIDVNIIGSQNIARVSIEKGVDIVIGISTDKACPPVRNIYGLSKASMEKLFCLMDSKSKTKFTCVRYGNVVWSTGSVFPVWKDMHEKTGMIKSTGPEMRRFFFTVDDAVKLVTDAIDNIETIHGKILSREMKAAQISDILDVWIELYGGKWETMEGRPGERNDEYLVGEIELDYSTKININGVNHFLISPNTKSTNRLENILYSNNTEKLTKEEIKNLILAKPDIL
jgi:UDP-N-acetylglucosamine 4,6-dehydratase